MLSPRRADGIVTVEFSLVLLAILPLFVAVGEFYRLSLCDQALARATHVAAMAAGRNPADCERAARTGFEGDPLARWLFDRNGDGAIAFGGATGEREVGLDIAADDGDVSNGVSFDKALCGNDGSWLRVRAEVSVRVPFGTGAIRRQHTSWALNQA